MSLTPIERAAVRVRQPGVTLLELVVALTLFGVIAALMLGFLRGQQRFHLGVLEIIDTKRSAHQAMDLLYGGLRGASSADIYAVSDSSVTFRATHGASHICAIDTVRASVTLPPTTMAGDVGLSAFLTMPRAGDSLLIFDPGDAPTADDDRWRAHVLTANPGGGGCPLRPIGLATRATESGAGIAIAVAPSLTASIPVGSPVRFFRPARYSLYRSTGAEWMLGYSTCAAGTCTVRQPLSGPYLPFASGGAGGIALRYFDAQGAPTSDRSRVARVDVVARARSGSMLDVAHLRGQRYQDSLAITIALRNPS
jgi:prepilin-type N-terminal cleavage/methylation domain-containing protein